MRNLTPLIAKNAERWRNAKAQSGRGFSLVAERLVNAKVKYLAIQKRTGVPWFVIAVIHEREASQKWDRSIAQGDPWNQASIHVPKGRGPFQSWDEAAIDALTNCQPYAAKWTDWSAGGTLTLLEQYNGLGYFYRGIPSPYIWAGTDQYVSGKFVADGVFKPEVIDSQLGCAGLLMAMRKIDQTIRFADEAMAPPDVEPVPPKPKPQPHIQTGTAGAATGAALHIFGMPWWAVLSAAFVVAVIVYLILRNRK